MLICPFSKGYGEMRTTPRNPFFSSNQALNLLGFPSLLPPKIFCTSYLSIEVDEDGKYGKLELQPSIRVTSNNKWMWSRLIEAMTINWERDWEQWACKVVKGGHFFLLRFLRHILKKISTIIAYNTGYFPRYYILVEKQLWYRLFNGYASNEDKLRACMIIFSWIW